MEEEGKTGKGSLRISYFALDKPSGYATILSNTTDSKQTQICESQRTAHQLCSYTWNGHSALLHT